MKKQTKRKEGLVPVQAYIDGQVVQTLQDNGVVVSQVIRRALTRLARKIERGEPV